MRVKPQQEPDWRGERSRSRAEKAKAGEMLSPVSCCEPLIALRAVKASREARQSAVLCEVKLRTPLQVGGACEAPMHKEGIHLIIIIMILIPIISTYLF